MNAAIQTFYSDNYSDFDLFWEVIRDGLSSKLVKSDKETIIHDYLWWISNNTSIKEEFRNCGYSQEIFLFYENTLKDLGVKIPSKIIPNFQYIEQHGFCEECRSCRKLISYVDWIEDKIDEYKPNIIHSAFHILMLNKHFLRDFMRKLLDL